jgi:hypothetical protein
VLIDRTTATPLARLRVRAVGPVTDGIRGSFAAPATAAARRSVADDPACAEP